MIAIDEESNQLHLEPLGLLINGNQAMNNQGQSSDERSRAIKHTCFLTRRSVAAFRKESRCVSTPMTRGKPCTCGEG